MARRGLADGLQHRCIFRNTLVVVGVGGVADDDPQKIGYKYGAEDGGKHSQHFSCRSNKPNLKMKTFFAVSIQLSLKSLPKNPNPKSFFHF